MQKRKWHEKGSDPFLRKLVTQQKVEYKISTTIDKGY